MKNLITLYFILLVNLAYTQNPHVGLYSPEITRITNYGNGMRYLELTDSSRLFIADNYFMPHPIYNGKNAAIQVSVFDWNAVVPGVYRLDYDSVSPNTTYKIYRVGTTDTVYSPGFLSVNYHHYITQWGLLVSVYEDPDTLNDPYNVIPDTSYFSYTSNNCNWISGMEDIDNHLHQDWILSGTDPFDLNSNDTNEIYEGILNGRFSPSKICNMHLTETGPWDSTYANILTMIDYAEFRSLDLVLTPDTNLWTRSAVIHTNNDFQTHKMEIMDFPSLGKNGMPDNSGTTGMSWFPGYAIDPEFGERLNIVFGEDTSLVSHNGNDGMFNPDSIRYENGNPVFGGNHWVYIFNNQDRFFPSGDRMPRYDDGNYIHSKLNGNSSDKINVWRSCSWVGSILPKIGYDFLDCEATMKIRVKYRNTRFKNNVIDTTASYEFNIPSSLPSSITETLWMDVKIFPNPSENGIFYLENKSKVKINFCELHDLYGKLLATEFVQSNYYHLNLSNLSSGIYLLSLFDENNSKKTFKLVID